MRSQDAVGVSCPPWGIHARLKRTRLAMHACEGKEANVTTLDLWNGYMRSYDYLSEIEAYRQNLRDVASRVRVATGTRILVAGSGTGLR